MTLRKDENQWLVYQQDSVEPAIAGVKSFLMALGAQVLLDNPDLVLRAFGHYGQRLTNTHLDLWIGRMTEQPSEEQAVVGQYLTEIYAWLAGEGERPDEALDELHAAVVWSDKRARAAGVTGEGWYRDLVKEP
jgi:hypothetical protein